jgi:hypothetical protein
MPPASAAPHSQQIDPRTTSVLCLPPGWRLQCLQGRVAVVSGPQLWGQVLHAQQHLLECGQHIEGGHDGMPTWLRLHCPDAGPVRLQLLEPAPQPGWTVNLYAVVCKLLRRPQSSAA